MGTFKVNNEPYYLIAGTDDAPNTLCYYFSLEYLKINPEHVISIFDVIVTIEKMLQIEKNSGFYEDWLTDINISNKKDM